MSFPVYGRLIRFESSDATNLVTFDGSRWRTEWESAQSLSGGVTTIHGANYGLPSWGSSPAPVQPSRERLRANVPNADIDLIRNIIPQIGRGRLWRRLEDESEQWAWARVDSVPAFTIGSRSYYYVPVIIPFTRLSDWYAAESTTVTETLTTSPQTVAATSNGMITTKAITVTMTANSAGGFDQAVINNTTTAEQFTVARTAVNGEIVTIDVLNFRMERSTDGGNVWTDDTANLKLGSTQVMPLSLVSGTNQIEITNASDAELSIEFFDAWR